MIKINFIKKLTIITLLIQGTLMGANLSQLKVNNTEVPFIFEEDKNLPIVSMQLIFRNSGSLSDTKDGLVQLSAALLNEGTKKDGSIGFATKLENRAITLGTHAGNETFVIEVGSLKEEFPYAIERLKELLTDPNYTEKTLEKIKTQAIGNLKRKESDFDYISALELKKMLFPNTPLAKASAGTVKSVESIKLVDIDKHLGEHLGVDNAIVVMGGDISQKEAAAFATSAIASLSIVHSKKIERMKALGQKKVQEKIVKSEQAYVYFGAPLNVAYDSKERHLAQVASFILGSSGFGSRMMEEIRVKKGLAYSAYSRFNINKTHSYFSGYLQTKIESGDEAVNSVKEVVQTFLDKGVSQEELTAAQQFLLGSEPLRNETLSQRLGRAFQEYYTNKPLGSATEDLKKIEAITLEEINAFIKKYKEIAELSFSVVTGEKK
ncbi:MAG: Zinc protease-like protein [uncultured Sulfurovum sp.]|uniref:Zinc protease-like protein n=1 Tax=uncultured Sulfurovum sp. TaxID=269237 RepID=A0A6S6TEB8_9BACT|nr:MAG: Zinc protease-like protein [uncultured Sulfurovum sp.]